MAINIAIDGPTGAGKSTIAKMLSQKLNFAYLDTGAMYRGLAYYVLKNNVKTDDSLNVIRLLPKIDMDIVYKNGLQRVVVCGEDVTDFLREHHMSLAASNVSKIPEVRLKLVELQRKIANVCNCVLDGRDIGSYVLPNAKYKLFITATPEERAKRRFLELAEKGSDLTYDKILEDVIFRDKQDSERDFAPLKIADGAIVIDTTNMNIEGVLQKVDKIICK